MLLSGSIWVPCTKGESLTTWSWGGLPWLSWISSCQEACHSLGLGGCLLGLGEQSGAREGGAAGADSCSLVEAPGDKVNGWDVGTCPINKWYEANSTPLNSTGLACRAAWHAERKSIWLLPSSWMTCSSRCLMILACCLWSESAWEAPLVSASLMVVEHWALASQMVWVQVPWLLWQLHSRGCKLPGQCRCRWP